MNTRKMESIGEMLPLLGFGCMRLPLLDEDPAHINEPAAQAMVDKAMESGLNYFDTAYRYHNAVSEPFMGKALARYERSSYYLATKMPMYEVKSKEQLSAIFEDQLQKLQTDYFDFYLAHSLDAELFERVKALDVFAFLNEQKERGRIRHLGFSFHDVPEVLDEICSAYPWEFCQIQLNYFDWTDYRSREQYEILQKHGIPAIVMEPLHGGLLADLGSEANAVLQQAAPGRSVASWGMRYAATLPNVMTVLSGMSTMEQLEDNLATFDPFEPLDAKESAALEEALAIYRRNFVIPCSGCRYCMPCPFGVNIPRNLTTYNMYAKDGDMQAFKQQYGFLEEASASACTACGQCKPKCPQMLAIPELLGQIAAGKEPSQLVR